MTNVILYTSSTCPTCAALKAKLKERSIAYVERNTDVDDVRLELYTIGRCTVPTLVVDKRVIEDIEGWLNTR